MKLFLHKKSNKRGIYKILNTSNGRAYYGSATRIKTRGYAHRKDLQENKHANLFLQNDYNKCGANAFIFEAVEVVKGNKEKLLKREQDFLDQFYDNQKQCYNICPIAGSREGSKNARPYDPETDGRAKPKPEEWIKTVSEKNKKTWSKPGRKKEASKHAQKRWDKHSADITVTHKETNETVTIEGSVRAFCEGRSISYKAFHLMVQGKTKSSGGWFLGTQEPEYVSQKGEKRKPLSKEHRAKIAGGKYAGVILKHKISGEMFVVGENVKEDCRQRGISYSSFTKMMKSKCKSASGWMNE
jgi:group I intron endonuclease